MPGGVRGGCEVYRQGRLSGCWGGGLGLMSIYWAEVLSESIRRHSPLGERDRTRGLEDIRIQSLEFGVLSVSTEFWSHKSCASGRVLDLRSRIWDSDFSIRLSSFGFWGLEFGIHDLKFGVWVLMSELWDLAPGVTSEVLGLNSGSLTFESRIQMRSLELGP